MVELHCWLLTYLLTHFLTQQKLLAALSIIDFSFFYRFCVLTDSLSNLKSIKNRKLDHPLIVEIFFYIHKLIISMSSCGC